VCIEANIGIDLADENMVCLSIILAFMYIDTRSCIKTPNLTKTLTAYQES
jgi:hypothetical protein